MKTRNFIAVLVLMLGAFSMVIGQTVSSNTTNGYFIGYDAYIEYTYEEPVRLDSFNVGLHCPVATELTTVEHPIIQQSNFDAATVFIELYVDDVFVKKFRKVIATGVDTVISFTIDPVYVNAYGSELKFYIRDSWSVPFSDHFKPIYDWSGRPLQVLEDGFNLSTSEDITTSVLELNNMSKEVVAAYDLAGRQVSPDLKNQMIIVVYSDGSTEKQFNN